MAVSSVRTVPASFRMRTEEESTHTDTVTFPAPSSSMTCGFSMVGVPSEYRPSVVHSRALASNSSSADSVRTEDRSVAWACSGSAYASHMVVMTYEACAPASASVPIEPVVLAGPADCGVMVLAMDCGAPDWPGPTLCAPDAAGGVCGSRRTHRRRPTTMTSATTTRIATARMLFLRAGESELMKSMCFPSIGYRERLPRGSGKVTHE